MTCRPFRQDSNLAVAMKKQWVRFWMRFAGLHPFGRIATGLAEWFALPHKARIYLAYQTRAGYVATSATIHHPGLQLGDNVFIGERVVVYQAKEGGPALLSDRVCILRDSVLETGYKGHIRIGTETWIQPRCQLNAYVAPIEIGRGVDIAPNCAFYSYDHGMAHGINIREQPLQSKGGIFIGDNAWLGVGVTVLSGVRVGAGAVVGAGSIVTRDVPDEAVAVGRPARVIKKRSDLVA
jgi:acetyltransferase-like isoleucine patch superfamily enzyme